MIEYDDAEALLEQAWNDIDKPQLTPQPKLRLLIEKILSAGTGAKGFKYLLVTGTLAKAVNPKLHPRAIQAGSQLLGAYDARSLCHKVVVGFEKTKGNLLGLSNEPFVNKALRHAEHDKANPQLRNKDMSAALHDALELIRTASPRDVYACLVHELRLGKARADSIKAAVVAGERTLLISYNFIDQFLTKADGGARLVAVWAAFLRLTNEGAEVKAYNPNQSDTYAKTTGDVELFLEETLVSASECKHRPLNLDDVEHGLRKNSSGAEYVFVIASGFQSGQEQKILQRLEDSKRGADISLIEAKRDFPIFLKMIGPHRRKQFGPIVVELLRQMREFDSADQAADLWNRLESEK